MYILTAKKSYNSTTYSSTARIIERTEIWHSTRTACSAAAWYRITESTEWRHCSNTSRGAVTGGDYCYYICTAYRVDYIHYLFTKYQPEMPDCVKNNNISCTSHLNLWAPGTRYQERKQTGKRKKGKKVKNETKTNIMRSGSRPSPDGIILLFAGTVSPMMCPADGQQNDDEKC